MRPALAPTLLLVTALLAGCAGDSDVDSRQSSSVTCVNGVCEVCADGRCAPCEGNACDECRDGDCQELDVAAEDAAQPAQPLPDVDVHEAIPLVGGLPERTWTFDAAPGATGHVHFFLRDLATKEAVVMGTLCFDFSVTTPTDHAHKRTNCGGSSNVVITGGTTNVGVLELGSWGVQGAGHYVVKAASSGSQANELVVDVVIDNP